MLLLTSCGSDSQPQNEKKPDKTVTPPIDPVDTKAPTADIIFPLPLSLSEVSSITVKGTASDSTDITEVKVNGIISELSIGTDAKAITWQAHIPLARNIVVETKDSLGNTNTEAATARVLFGEAPMSFIIDDTYNRLIGQLGSGKILTVDLASLEQQTIATDNFAGGKLSYSSKENVVYLSNTNDGNLSILSVDLITGSTTLEHSYQFEFASGSWGWTNLERVDFSQDENALYLLINYYYSDRTVGGKSLILKYDVSANMLTTVVDGVSAAGQEIYTSQIAYTNDGLLILNKEHLSQYNYRTTGISKLALNGAAINQFIKPTDFTPYLLTANLNENFVYSITWDSIDKVNLASGDIENISLDSKESELNFSQMATADIDTLNNKLLVSDYDLDMIVSIDLNSGERSRFLHNGIGTGKPIISARNLIIDDKKNIAYIADDGENGPEVILAIDLSTGNRTQVGDINNEYNVYINDLVLDAESSILYVVFAKEILKVNIDTQQTEILSSTSVGPGTTFEHLSGAVLDKSNNQLIVADSTNSLLMSVSLDTGTRTILSSHIAGVGTGEPLGFISGITFDKSNDIAFVSNNGIIFTVDLTTGNRSRLFDSCLDVYGNTYLIGGSGNSIGNLFFDENQKKLYVAAHKLLSYDINTGDCIASNFQYPLDVGVTTKGQILLSTWDGLVQFDSVTNESVTISK